MRPFTHLVTVLAYIVSQMLVMLANASPVMSCAHNTPSVPSLLPASITPASFVQPPRSQQSPESTPTSGFTASAFGGGLVPPTGAHSPPGPFITQAPNAEPNATYKGHGEKFVQTTYYSCVTLGTYTHCGWHEPILDASTSGALASGSRRCQPALWCMTLVVSVLICLCH